LHRKQIEKGREGFGETYLKLLENCGKEIEKLCGKEKLSSFSFPDFNQNLPERILSR
jgi:hypothetical protein